MENFKLSVAFYTSGLVSSFVNSQSITPSTPFTQLLVPANINSFQLIFDEFLSKQSQDILQHVSSAVYDIGKKTETLKRSEK